MSFRFSVITICKNDLAGLKKTVHSLLSQNFNNIDYIVIDGNSEDGTKDYLKMVDLDLRHSNVSFSFISEPDTGIYNAMNKGLHLASGDYVGFLNAGDEYASCDTLNNLHAEISRSSKNIIIYGNKLYFGDDGKINRVWRAGSFSRHKYYLGWMTPHQSTYIPNIFYEKYGFFDTSLKIAADYELMFRLLFVNRLEARYVDIDIVNMQNGGISNGSLKNIIRSNFEVLIAWWRYTLFVPLWVFFTKPFSKILQVIRQKLRKTLSRWLGTSEF